MTHGAVTLSGGSLLLHISASLSASGNYTYCSHTPQCKDIATLANSKTPNLKRSHKILAATSHGWKTFSNALTYEWFGSSTLGNTMLESCTTQQLPTNPIIETISFVQTDEWLWVVNNTQLPAHPAPSMASTFCTSTHVRSDLHHVAAGEQHRASTSAACARQVMPGGNPTAFRRTALRAFAAPPAFRNAHAPRTHPVLAANHCVPRIARRRGASPAASVAVFGQHSALAALTHQAHRA